MDLLIGSASWDILEKGEFLLVDEKAIYIFNLLQFGQEDSSHKSYEDFEINLTI